MELSVISRNVSPLAFSWQLINRPTYSMRIWNSTHAETQLRSADCRALMLKCSKPADSQSQNGTQFVNGKIKLAPFNYLKDLRPGSQAFRQLSKALWLKSLASSPRSGTIQQSCGRLQSHVGMKLSFRRMISQSIKFLNIVQWNQKYLKCKPCRY